jgi:hypothetical protein
MENENVVHFPRSAPPTEGAGMSVHLRLRNGVIAYEIEGIPDTRAGKCAAARQLEAVIMDLRK